MGGDTGDCIMCCALVLFIELKPRHHHHKHQNIKTETNLRFRCAASSHQVSNVDWQVWPVKSREQQLLKYIHGLSDTDIVNCKSTITSKLKKRRFDRKASAFFGSKVGKKTNKTKATAYIKVHILRVRG